MGYISQNTLKALIEAIEGCEITLGNLIKYKDCETCIKVKVLRVVLVAVGNLVAN